MDSYRVPIRKSLETQMTRAYLNFAMPKMAPNFMDMLPIKYQFADAPGYDDFCTAYELEYVQGRLVEARELYESASRLGHPLASYCYGLWFLYGDRSGTEKDLRKAFQKFCVAHKAGLGQATYQLADYYRTGKGKVVARDVKKSFAFLLQSLLDSRIHFVLDFVPFCLLGLAYGLGRGPSVASIADAVRCLDRGIHYAYYQQNASLPIINGVPPMVDNDFSCMYQLAMLVMQWDGEEIKRQVQLRLDAMETALEDLPPGRSMMTVAEFSGLAKTFGLSFDEFLGSLGEAKGEKRMTWKSFRRFSDGRARALATYERQAIVEHWPSFEPDDPELLKYLEELDTRCKASVNEDEFSNEDNLGLRLYSVGELNENDANLGDGGNIENGNDFGAGNSSYLYMDGVPVEKAPGVILRSHIPDGQNMQDGNLMEPKNEEDGGTENGELGDGNQTIPEVNEAIQV